MGADRGSAIYAAYDARRREEAMDYETEHSASVLTTEAIQGAKKFTAGWGRCSHLQSVLLILLYLSLFYGKDSMISIRVFFIIDSSLFHRSGKFNVNKVKEPEVG